MLKRSICSAALLVAVPASAASAAPTVEPDAVSEGVATLTLKRDNSPRPPATYRVQLVAADSPTPATPDEDFQSGPRRVSFPVGSTEVKFDMGFGSGRVIEPTEPVRIVVRDSEDAVVADELIAIHDDDAEFAETDVTVREMVGRVTLRLARPWAIETTQAYPLAALTPDNQPALGVTLPAEPVQMLAGTAAASFDVGFAVDPQAGADRTFKVLLAPGRDPAATEAAQPRAVARVTVLDDDVQAPAASITVGRSVRIGRTLLATLTTDELGDVVATLRVDRRTARRLRVPRRLAVDSGDARPGQVTRLALRPSRRTARRLRARPRVPAELLVVVSDAAGNEQTSARPIVLRR